MKASGFHSAQSSNSSKEKHAAAPVETNTPPPSKIVVPKEGGTIDDKGSYGALVYIYDSSKRRGAGSWSRKKSSMYPDDWSKDKVEAEIQEAYQTAIKDGSLEDVSGGKKLFTSTNASGVTVEGIYNPATDQVETAHPVVPNA